MDAVKKVSIFLFFTLSLLTTQLSYANPTGEQVTAGTVGFSKPNATTLNVTQSSNQAIVNWQNFSIQQNETTRFIQPSANSVILNRVVSNEVDPTKIQTSNILGTLTATGQVFIVNPAGIFFGPQSHVDVAGLVATTASMTDANFLAGKYQFTDPGTPQGSIINQGFITAQKNGLVALLAPNIQNQGVIQAQAGEILLASGNAFTLSFQGDQLINFTIDKQASQSDSGITNLGHLIANDGKIILSANVAKGVVDNVINMQGIAEARSVAHQNGSIVLSGHSAGTVLVGGRLDVSGIHPSESSSNITLVGKNVHVTSSAVLNANGVLAGGQILIGGGYHGDIIYPELANADTTLIDSGATLTADATQQGNGGTIVAWSNQNTTAQGSFSAQGGPNGGHGGLIETSSAGELNTASISVNAAAPQGLAGTWLLDPTDITINSVLASTIESTLNGGTNVTETATGNIIDDAAIRWATSTTLSLAAGKNLFLNAGADITAPLGTLSLSAQNAAQSITSGTPDSPNSVGVQANIDVANFTLSQGDWYQHNPSLPNFNVTNNFQIAEGNSSSPYNGLYQGQFERITGGTGNSSSPYQITDIYGLQGMGTMPITSTSYYELTQNIDASTTANWSNSTAPGGTLLGFTPIGNVRFGGESFKGNFNGQNNVISHLYEKTASADAGLFGDTAGATIKNAGLSFANISATGNSIVGSIAGDAQDLSRTPTTINNVFSTNATIKNSTSLVGGITGNLINSTLSNAYVSGTVSAPDTAGGLVGHAFGATIENSYNLAFVTAAIQYAGGLVGLVGTPSVEGALPNLIDNSYNAGTVSGNSSIGGLVGMIKGTNPTTSIQTSYNTGPVIGNLAVGGLVGNIEGANNTYPISITNSYNLGRVTSNNNAGGIVGNIFLSRDNGSPVSLSNTYNAATVSGGGFVGALVGSLNGGTQPTSITDSFWDDPVTSSTALSALGLSAGPNITLSNLNAGCFACETLPVLSQITPYKNVGWNISSSDDTTSTPWKIISGRSYPYLTALFPTTPQAFSGTGFVGSTPVSADYVVALAAEGKTLSTTITGSNGAYYFLFPTNSVPTNSAFITYLSNSSPAGTAAANVGNNESLIGLNIVSNKLLSTGTSALSNTGLLNAKSNLTDTGIIFNGSGTSITMPSNTNFIVGSPTTQTPYSLDGNITLSGTGNLTFNGPVTLTTPSSTLATHTGNITFDTALTGNNNNLTLQGSSNNLFTLPPTTRGVNELTVQGNGSNTITLANVLMGINLIIAKNLTNLLVDAAINILSHSMTFRIDTGEITFTNNSVVTGNENNLTIEGSVGNNVFTFNGSFSGLNSLNIFGGGVGNNTVSFANPLASITSLRIDEGSSGHNTIALLGAIANMTDVIINAGSAGNNTITLPGPITNVGTFNLSGYGSQSFTSLVNNVGTFVLSGAPAGGNNIAITGPISNIHTFILNGGAAGNNHLTLSGSLNNMTSATINAGPGAGDTLSITGPVNHMFEFNLFGGNSGGNTFSLMAPMSNITTLTIEGGGGPNNYFLTGGPFNNIQRTLILDTALSNDVLQVPSSQFIISDLGLMLGVPGINGLFFPTLARPTVVTLIGTGGATTTSGMYIFQSPLTQSLQTDLLTQSTSFTDSHPLSVTNTSENTLMNYNSQRDFFVADNIQKLKNLKAIEPNCITLGSSQVCQNHTNGQTLQPWKQYEY